MHATMAIEGGADKRAPGAGASSAAAYDPPPNAAAVSTVRTRISRSLKRVAVTYSTTLLVAQAVALVNSLFVMAILRYRYGTHDCGLYI
jgi:hypothetical protein